VEIKGTWTIVAGEEEKADIRLVNGATTQVLAEYNNFGSSNADQQVDITVRVVRTGAAEVKFQAEIKPTDSDYVTRLYSVSPWTTLGGVDFTVSTSIQYRCSETAVAGVTNTARSATIFLV
jgi:hypothetical protein